jgi:hypothetical protein
MLQPPKASALCIASLTASLLVCFISPADGGTYRADVDDSVFLQIGNGVIAEPVGFLDGASPSFDFSGSAVLIRPDVMLTAAHITSIMTGADLTIGGQSRTATAWVTHPDWTDNLLAGNDLGLVWLDEPVENVTPAQLYSGSGEQGKVALSAGYGRYGDGETGAVGFDGQKRAGTNVIDLKLLGKILITDLDDPGNPLGLFFPSYRPTPFELLINQGDSGGGTFIADGGQVYLAGIHSFIGSLDPTYGNYGDIAGSVAVSPWVDWINATIENPASASTLTFASDVPGNALASQSILTTNVVVPEPSSLALAALGALALLRRQRNARQSAVNSCPDVR